MPHMIVAYIIVAVQLIDDIVAFFNKVFELFASALFVFGSGWDIVRTVIDIAICATVFYFVLALVRNTRAWQLLKGLILIVVFSLFSGFLGLQTMNYILSSTISFMAIALLVIFQPELRRALEKMGRKTGGFLSTVSGEHTVTETEVEQLAHEIALACKNMAKDRCGALIILERQTPTAELADQPNAIKVDAAVTAMNLMQIFYEGSPMHDGAVLIRNGRIYAARCHVPLSEDTRVKDGLGTRHRAAIGASEMSDAIGVVVSEERGTISLTLEGRLYRINDSEKLRRILLRLMTPKKARSDAPLPQKLWHRLFDRQQESESKQIGFSEGEGE
ncbi:MAG TPA: TIGR00159 family protein, partial [Clostridiaceae bacterium]|nr:TIGR00159 family protein [Clostridiaceae bacterium]